MDDLSRPTIKGLFVKSHIRALEEECGREAVLKLQHMLGRSVHFNTTDDVPVSDEIKILEFIVDITAPTLLSKEERVMEAGRLHFRNFSTTVMWTLVQQIFGTNFKFLIMQSSRIASWVFRGIEFRSTDMGGKNVKISMFNTDYPIEHFHGFFEQWLRLAGVTGTVTPSSTEEGRYDYVISWV